MAHARRAGKLLRAWFLDAETRMNPHLRFTQIRPGVHSGTGSGIIDTTSLVFLADAISHLPFNDDWTSQHLAGVKDWFAQYLDQVHAHEPARRADRLKRGDCKGSPDGQLRGRARL